MALRQIGRHGDQTAGRKLATDRRGFTRMETKSFFPCDPGKKQMSVQTTRRTPIVRPLISADVRQPKFSPASYPREFASGCLADSAAPIRVYQWPCLISGLVAVAIRLRPMAVSQLPSSTLGSIGQSSSPKGDCDGVRKVLIKAPSPQTVMEEKRLNQGPTGTSGSVSSQDAKDSIASAPMLRSWTRNRRCSKRGLGTSLR